MSPTPDLASVTDSSTSFISYFVLITFIQCNCCTSGPPFLCHINWIYGRRNGVVGSISFSHYVISCTTKHQNTAVSSYIAFHPCKKLRHPCEGSVLVSEAFCITFWFQSHTHNSTQIIFFIILKCYSSTAISWAHTCTCRTAKRKLKSKLTSHIWKASMIYICSKCWQVWDTKARHCMELI